jgi:hypothetical protein
MGTVSVSDVSFDESESAVITPAVKATHAVTRASTTLRVLARRRGGRRTLSTLMPSRHENRQYLGSRQFFGSGKLVFPVSLPLDPMDLTAAPPVDLDRRRSRASAKPNSSARRTA